MSEPTAFALGHLFTNLMGRQVQFRQAAAGVSVSKQIYGIYQVLPDSTAIVVKADLPLLCSFGGVLVGLPDTAVKEHMKGGSLDELLRDAVHEVLNIGATAVTSQGRAVFQKMVLEAAYVDGAAGAVLKKPGHRWFFDVSIEGYQGGKFCIFAPFEPVKVVNG